MMMYEKEGRAQGEVAVAMWRLYSNPEGPARTSSV